MQFQGFDSFSTSFIMSSIVRRFLSFSFSLLQVHFSCILMALVLHLHVVVVAVETLNIFFELHVRTTMKTRYIHGKTSETMHSGVIQCIGALRLVGRLSCYRIEVIGLLSAQRT